MKKIQDKNKAVKQAKKKGEHELKRKAVRAGFAKNKKHITSLKTMRRLIKLASKSKKFSMNPTEKKTMKRSLLSRLNPFK